MRKAVDFEKKEIDIRFNQESYTLDCFFDCFISRVAAFPKEKKKRGRDRIILIRFGSASIYLPIKQKNDGLHDLIQTYTRIIKHKPGTAKSNEEYPLILSLFSKILLFFFMLIILLLNKCSKTNHICFHYVLNE